jgi:uncharacterized protein YraI
VVLESVRRRRVSHQATAANGRNPLLANPRLPKERGATSSERVLTFRLGSLRAFAAKYPSQYPVYVVEPERLPIAVMLARNAREILPPVTGGRDDTLWLRVDHDSTTPPELCIAARSAYWRAPRGSMRRFTRLAAALVALHAHAASGQVHDTGYKAYTRTATNLRTAASPHAPLIATIPKGALVAVVSCDTGWCAIGCRAGSGFVAQALLTTDSSAATSTLLPKGRGYTNSQGNRVQSPARTPNGKPPANASAKCRDGTFSFSQSRRGTCSHHGGVAEWLR